MRAPGVTRVRASRTLMASASGRAGELGYGKTLLPLPIRACQCSAPVAQLDRVPGYEPGGREFESLRARQLSSCSGLNILAASEYFLPSDIPCHGLGLVSAVVLGFGDYSHRVSC